MPWSSKRPCRRCRVGLSRHRSGYCPACLITVRQEQDARRGTAHERGYTRRWAAAAKRHLVEHPLCAACEAVGRVTAATIVDHITPHRGDQALFWDRDNWQSLCKPCHDRKTAIGEAFGREGRSKVQPKGCADRRSGRFPALPELDGCGK